MAALFFVIFHVWHYVTENDYILYFVGNLKYFGRIHFLVGLGKLTANFAQRQNLKNFIKFLK